MTKLALWTTVPAAKKRLEAAATTRQALKAARLALKRGKAALAASRRRLARIRKPGKRVAPRSAAMTGKMAVYRRLKGEFLTAYRYCARCCNPSWNMEVHHTRGRAGALLLDARYWLAVCPACHRWIHDNINEARESNLIAAPGDWNNPK